jgi:cytochrome c-type biogenesis protein
VLPLYPGFLAYLSSQFKKAAPEVQPTPAPEKEGVSENTTQISLPPEPDKKSIALFGVVITVGVVLFMFVLGLIFTTVLQVSLTNVIGLVSPIAFGILTVISLLLIADVDIGKYIPKKSAPITKNPFISAFIFGFFFGAIVVPCNPLFIAALFAGAVSAMGVVENMVSFIFFGIGLAFPLLIFSFISSAKSQAVIGYLTARKTIINRTAGILMLIISVYYLVFVFRLFG